jgi:hypothetical protein
MKFTSSIAVPMLACESFIRRHLKQKVRINERPIPNHFNKAPIKYNVLPKFGQFREMQRLPIAQWHHKTVEIIFKTTQQHNH